MTVRNILNRVGLGAMALAWIGFEFFNGITTLLALQMIIPAGPSIELEIAVIGLGLSLILIDLGGLGRALTSERSFMREPLTIKMLTATWLIAAVINAFFTWWDVSVRIQSSAIVAPREMANAGGAVAAMVAVLVFAIRVTLIVTFTSMLESEIHGFRPSRTDSRRGVMPPPMRAPVPTGVQSPLFSTKAEDDPVPTYHSLIPQADGRASPRPGSRLGPRKQ